MLPAPPPPPRPPPSTPPTPLFEGIVMGLDPGQYLSSSEMCPSTMPSPPPSILVIIWPIAVQKCAPLPCPPPPPPRSWLIAVQKMCPSTMPSSPPPPPPPPAIRRIIIGLDLGQYLSSSKMLTPHTPRAPYPLPFLKG